MMGDYMLKVVDNKMIVTAPILEVYLPFEYVTKGLYSMKGEFIDFFAVCNIKAFKNETELEHREAVKTIPVGLCIMITSNPSELDVAEVKFSPESPFRKCQILRYYKDDEFAVNTSCISQAGNVSSFMDMLENGKLDFIPVRFIRDIIDRAEKINRMDLRLSSEAKDALIAESYRDPNNIHRGLRFAKDKNSEKVLSVTAREDAILSSTYQAFTFEDVNSSLIASVNRAKAGVKEEPTVMEQIIRGGTVKPTVEQETSV